MHYTFAPTLNPMRTLAARLANACSQQEQRRITDGAILETRDGKLAVILSDANRETVALGWITPTGVIRDRNTDAAVSSLAFVLSEGDMLRRYTTLVALALAAH